MRVWQTVAPPSRVWMFQLTARAVSRCERATDSDHTDKTVSVAWQGNCWPALAAQILARPTRNLPDSPDWPLWACLHLTYRVSKRRLEITILSFAMPLNGQLSQWKHYETLHGTRIRRDDLLFMSIIDPMFSFLLSIIGSRRILFFKLFQYRVFMAELVLYTLFQNKCSTRSSWQEAVPLLSTRSTTVDTK